MSDERWLDVCREGCSVARTLGADEAEVYAQSTDEVSAVIEKHDLQVARSSRDATLGVRVLLGDRLGFASTNCPTDLPSVCRDAVALAKAAPGDPSNGLPAAQEVAAVPGLLDLDRDRVTLADIVDRAAQILQVAEAMDARLIVGDAAVSAVRTARAIATTRGIFATESTTLFTHHVLVTAKEGERVSSMDYQFGASRMAADIDVEPTVALACRNALGSLGPARGETFRGVVILSPSAALDILLGPILFHANARNALRGLTRWGDRLGCDVASRSLSVVDDGTSAGGVASSAFDREGVPHAPLSIIERGRLTALLHNAYTSSAFRCPNTGHASGSASSPPTIGPTNLRVGCGDAPLDEMIGDTRQGLLVARFSGNVDPISGDFSGIAKAAHLIQGGHRVAPVSGCLIAGNVFDALTAVLDTSRESQQIFGAVLPYVRIDGTSVSAA